ncbi:hypothetical protein Barb6XT_00225 [Bacteroidales bacterium Barb6XT]|nr:hypothetical protein Barb6XT_00225 [Bacteroidales bacterium Barb6XT]
MSQCSSGKKIKAGFAKEGLGFRSIGRLSGVSNVSVLNRIRKFGKETQVLHLESKKNREGRS